MGVDFVKEGKTEVDKWTSEVGGGGDEQEYAGARRSPSLTAERSLNRFPFPHNLEVFCYQFNLSYSRYYTVVR